MGPAVVQQPKHGNARRTAELIGADRVLPATPRSTKKMPVHAALLAELYLPEICQGPIRDCGRMTGMAIGAPQAHAKLGSSARFVR